jgi:FMN reductase
MQQLRIVGIGGSTRPDSSSEVALRIALAAGASAGAETTLLPAASLALPFYDPVQAKQSTAADGYLRAVRGADGLIISSPGYHGGISGLIKNAIDWLEELAHDERPYVDTVPVGCISVAGGAQTSVAAMVSLRTVVHTLRGFPTPLGVAVNAVPGLFRAGECTDAAVRSQLTQLGRQVADYAALVRASRPAAEPVG